jgi:magnesium transporter
VPTVVGGIYGMNFAHLPELTWRYGYPGALLLILVGVVVLHRLLRRAGWL